MRACRVQNTGQYAENYIRDDHFVSWPVVVLWCWLTVTLWMEMHAIPWMVNDHPARWRRSADGLQAVGPWTHGRTDWGSEEASGKPIGFRKEKKAKLCERWSDEGRTSKQFAEEPDEASDEPPGLDIFVAILSRAQTRYKGIWLPLFYRIISDRFLANLHGLFDGFNHSFMWTSWIACSHFWASSDNHLISVTKLLFSSGFYTFIIQTF